MPPLDSSALCDIDWSAAVTSVPYLVDLHPAVLVAVPVGLRLETDSQPDPRGGLTRQHRPSVSESSRAATDPPVWVSPTGTRYPRGDRS